MYKSIIESKNVFGGLNQWVHKFNNRFAHLLYRDGQENDNKVYMD